MVKETVKYATFEKRIQGYGWLVPPKELNENSILDALCEWSKDKKAKIYSHALEKKEEGFEKYSGQVYIPNGGPELKIPYCDWVYYLNIWYQEA